MSDLATPDWATPEEIRLLTPKGLAVFARKELYPQKIVSADETSLVLKGSLSDCVALNHSLRIPHRVLYRLIQFSANTPKQLYNELVRIRWEEIIETDGHLSLDGYIRTESIRDHRFALLTAKDAIVDRIRDQVGTRPDAGPATAQSVRVFLHWQDRRVSVYLDTSGESLSHRGFRAEAGEAPLRESLACACLMAGEWSPDMPLVVPFAGSGTIAIEAARWAANLSPRSEHRHYAYRNIRGYDRAFEPEPVAESENRTSNPQILAFDSDDRLWREGGVARSQAEAAQVDAMITWETEDFRDARFPETPSVMIMNPPYGQRLQPGEEDELAELYRNIGEHIGRLAPGSRAVVITDRPEWIDCIGRKTKRQYPVYNGPIRCRVGVWEVT